MRTRVVVVSILAACVSVALAQARKTLDIYVVDVEGGNAVLFVAPSGESVLIDSGNGGAGAARDAGRVAAAAKDAGLTQIDHVITTHYHQDHIGALAELASRIPIREFIDHGPNVQPSAAIDPILAQYEKLYAGARHTVVKPGDKVAVAGLDWRIVTAAAKTLTGSGSPNPYCAAFKPQDGPTNEDDQSVGSVIAFGKFRTIHLGDLTLNRQFDLMCPANRIGTVDLLIAARHGNVNAEFLTHAIRPRAIISNNGTRKGAPPDAVKIFLSSPGVEDLWQVHFSLLGGQEYAVPGMFIANTFDDQPAALPVAPYTPPPAGTQAPPAPAHDGAAFYVKVSAQQDGTFTVTNMRNMFSRTYTAGSSRN